MREAYRIVGRVGMQEDKRKREKREEQTGGGVEIWIGATLVFRI